MANVDSSLKRRGFGKTSRTDAWWAQPAVVFFILTLFIVYATWAAFQDRNFWYHNYISPFYSPELFGDGPFSLFGPKPGWWPAWLIFSPALIILPFPALFRFTCYYYRGAYYKAFWADPPSCAVSEPRKKYTGENGLPLILQNVHRYFFYVAVIFLVFLWIDVYNGFDRNGRFFVGVGSLVLLAATSLLTFYTLSCHSFRHLIGGRIDCLSRSPIRLACYSCVTGQNKFHMRWAWLSLFGVMFADLYVRLIATGVWHDFIFIR